MSLLWFLCLLTLISFSCFTIYVTAKENFFNSCRYVWAKLWGVQVTMDLFIGIFLFHIFVYLREGSLITTLSWLIPSLIIGNPVTLLYMLVRVL